jgi:multiple antibiotic resistance protein
MSVAITLGANTSQSDINIVAMIVAMITGVALIALFIFLCYHFAENISRVLGPTGTSVLLRLSAFIALCIGVQIIWNGLSTLVKSLMKG